MLSYFSSAVVNPRLPLELQKRFVALLSSPAEQHQVLSAAVLRETLPLTGQELNYNQDNLGQLNSHAAGLLLSQVGRTEIVWLSLLLHYCETCIYKTHHMILQLRI